MTDGGLTLYDPITPIALGLMGCLCNAFADAGRPVCRCTLYHGQDPPPMDLCDCECSPGVSGQAWVRVDGINPSDSGNGDPCGGRLLGAMLSLEVGVYRCIAVPDDRGVPPSGDEQMTDALEAYQDAAVLRHAVACCEALEDRVVQVGRWQPMGPAGGCAGSRWDVSVML